MPLPLRLLRRLAPCAARAALFVTLVAPPALAQDTNMPLPLASRSLSTNAITALNSHIAVPLDLFRTPEDEPSATSPAHSGRPRALLPLYVSFASLQALDVASTHRALDLGAHEVNPIVEPFANSTAALVAMKAGTTAAIIYLTERLRKRHPVAAVALMVSLNAGFASIVVHNYSVKGR